MKIIWSTLIAGGMVYSASAQEPEPISTKAIYACAEISEDLARLACYDETVGRLEAAEEAGEVTTISKAEVKEIERDSFGFSLPSIARNVIPKFGNGDEESLDEVELAVESVRRLTYKNLRVTLENGQVWEQIDSQRVNYSTKRGVETAVIKKASLGSFKMKLDGGRAFRVKRIK